MTGSGTRIGQQAANCGHTGSRNARPIAVIPRTFFARVPDDLFLSAPHLVDTQANYHQIVPDWFADTNLSNESKERILIQACAIAHVSYANQFEIEYVLPIVPMSVKVPVALMLYIETSFAPEFVT